MPSIDPSAAPGPDNQPDDLDDLDDLDPLEEDFQVPHPLPPGETSETDEFPPPTIAVEPPDDPSNIIRHD